MANKFKEAYRKAQIFSKIANERLATDEGVKGFLVSTQKAIDFGEDFLHLVYLKAYRLFFGENKFSLSNSEKNCLRSMAVRIDGMEWLPKVSRFSEKNWSKQMSVTSADRILIALTYPMISFEKKATYQRSKFQHIRDNYRSY